LKIEGEDNYIEAGRIADKVKSEIRSIVKPGKLVLDVCNEVERLIRDLSGSLAFPCNVCLDEVAAHYSSSPRDDTRIPEKCLVKVDWGVSIDGYISDTALTLALDEAYIPLISASEKALKTAIDTMKPGVTLKEVGSKIEQAIRNYGFKPIRNLSGHKMERYMLHTGKSVPNVAMGGDMKVLEGEVYAVEPFVTTVEGSGRVVDGHETHIYKYVKEKGLKDEGDKALIQNIKNNFGSLPFSLRWIENTGDDLGFTNCFQRLLDRGCVTGYPVLIEGLGKPVAQTERTVLIKGDGCVVLAA
jgi:methionyl aminopeptidase